MFSLRAVPSPQGRSLGVQRQVTAATSKCPVGALFDKMGGRENVKAAVDKVRCCCAHEPMHVSALGTQRYSSAHRKFLGSLTFN